MEDPWGRELLGLPDGSPGVMEDPWGRELFGLPDGSPGAMEDPWGTGVLMSRVL